MYRALLVFVPFLALKMLVGNHLPVGALCPILVSPAAAVVQGDLVVRGDRRLPSRLSTPVVGERSETWDNGGPGGSPR